MAAISSAESSKPKTSMFSRWRCGVADLGIGRAPICTCQRRMTCPGVTPWAFAAATIGVCGTLGQIAITEAFARGEASLIAPLEYSALAWAMGFDLLLWQTLPDGVTLTGAGIIVAAGLYLLHRERSPVATLPENG